MRLLAILIALAAVLPAQQAAADVAKPAFEVASVRLHQGPISKVDLAISGPRVTIFAYTLGSLIADAYDLKDYQLAGIPGKAAPDRYDIAAKAEGEAAPTMDQVRPMLQSLLADRFNLKTHRETREMPVYALVIAKNGPKLKENTGNTNGVPLAKFGNEGRNAIWTFTGASIGLLATLLPNTPGVDRPVLDKTGLTGRYDFRLTVTDVQLRLNPEPRSISAPDPDAASIFTVMQEQPGLKLEPAKGQVDVLVVDHVEKTSEN